MNEAEFKKKAKEAGYSDEQIKEFVEIHNKYKLPYDAIPLITMHID